jgi:hypothetical protein
MAFNLLDVIEHSMKFGFVVQKYSIKNKKLEIGTQDKKVHLVYMPNPKYYDLCGKPSHVFFDGTKLDDKFLKNKIRGVDFNYLKPKLDFIREHTVYQNINTDLPVIKIKIERENVKKFISDILLKHGIDEKYFIHTTKAIKSNYLDEFLKMYQEYYIVKNHYGNLRGTNTAKDCNIHLMLGSYVLPDTFEIALGLEFIQELLIHREPLSIRYEFWDFEGTNSIKKYKPMYEDIYKISKAYRHAEQRQALARTRHINHSVIFYILAKEPVHTYETFLPEPITYQYRDDLFPPRKQQGDAKYEQIKDAIVKALTLPDNNGEMKNKVCDFDIHKLTDIHRATVKKYRKQLVDEGFLVMITARFYKLSL